MSIRNRYAAKVIWTTAASRRSGLRLLPRSGQTSRHPHLDAARSAGHRLDDVSVWLDDLRVEARAEAEEAFPADRLAAQQAQIFRRLEALERPARVIAFPRSLGRPTSHAAAAPLGRHRGGRRPRHRYRRGQSSILKTAPAPRRSPLAQAAGRHSALEQAPPQGPAGQRWPSATKRCCRSSDVASRAARQIAAGGRRHDAAGPRLPRLAGNSWRLTRSL